MGFTEISENKTKKKFTLETLKERDLIINMLKYEDSIIRGETGKKIYTNPTYNYTKSFDAEHAIIRLVLDNFDFETDDSAIENYNKIFKTYYNSPTDYDSEVLKSVAYMRENKCVYYTKPEIKVGDTINNCLLYDVDGNKTSIIESLGEFEHAFIAGFSNS